MSKSVEIFTAPRKGGLGLLGFGEAAQAFLAGMTMALDDGPGTFDIKFNQPSQAKQKRAEAIGMNVEACADCAALMGRSTYVFSLVTADQAADAAQVAASDIQPGTYFFDGNSCAPSTKIANSKRITEAGGIYVDMAIMAPVHPAGIKTPISVSGPESGTAAEILRRFGMNVTIVPGPVGQASTIKMVRSIMVKGLEALTAECGLAAHRAGIADVIFSSLEKSYPGFGFEDRTGYNLERMMVHGARRAAEMKEVAKTLDDLGLPSAMAAATVKWQEEIGALGLEPGRLETSARLGLVSTALTEEKAHE